MVDVSEKAVTHRVAVARGAVRMAPETLAHVAEGTGEEGRRAGGGAARRHHGGEADGRSRAALPPARADQGDARPRADAATSRVLIEAEVRTAGQTGVEMEALTAVTVAALTVYDMLKAADRAMVIEDVRLALKDGGKSGRYEAP
jgi:cyclic pyranopterin monophosphate synthase